MENYFILLELPFDPPENDIGKIKDAISNKQKEWCLACTPVKVAQCREYLSHLDKIKTVMLDPKLREEAENAKHIKNAQLRVLKNKLRLFHTKTTILSERDMKILIKQFGKYGFSIDEIQMEFKRIS